MKQGRYNSMGNEEDGEGNSSVTQIDILSETKRRRVPKWLRPCFGTKRGTYFSLGFLGLLTIAIIATTVKVIHDNKPAEKKVWEEIRLPGNVIPESYSIKLFPDIEQSKFSGTVDISAFVSPATDTIVIHAVDMNITDVSLQAAPTVGGALPTSTFFYPENEFFVMQWPSPISGAVDLHLAFAAELKDGLEGLYRSSYTSSDGKKHYIATTQFEATDARKAFPCFDEPKMKANFSMTVTATNNRTVLFNMPETSTVRNDTTGHVDWVFPPTVRMSTYLVALVVSDFVNVTRTTTSGTRVSVWAPAEKIGQAQLALDAGVKILTFYEDYFGIPFPLPKQDMVAIPDFAAGAMENWGLITYRETALLFDPDKDTAANQQRVVVVVAHELAHQWFGNLVTMDWWSGLWLNEGFASYLEFLSTQFYNSTFQMWDQRITDTLQSSLKLDSSQDSHPIVATDVRTPNEINELFDAITYDKGNSIITMLIDMVGEDVFKTGVSAYLNKFAYSNAATSDLWEAIQQAADDAQKTIDVASVMNTWTLQMNYPLLTVAPDPVSPGKVTVTQSRFLIDGNGSESTGYVWDILLTGTTSTKKIISQWMKNGESSATLNGYNSTTDGYLHLNANATGFYRVNYSSDIWDAFVQDEMSTLTVPEKIQVLDDAFALAEVNIVSDTVALNLTTLLAKEKSYFVWDGFFQGFLQYYVAMRTSEALPSLKAYISALVSDRYDELGWETKPTDSHTDRLLRSLILQQACRYNHSDSREQARKSLAEHIYQQKAISPDIMQTVYYFGVAQGGLPEWEWMYSRYLNSSSAAEAKVALRALSYTQDLSLIARTLEYALDSDKVRSQDAISLLLAVGGSEYGQSATWDFVRENWTKIRERFGSGSSFDALFKFCSAFQTQVKYDEFEAFFSGKDLGSAGRAYNRTLGSIQVRIRWMEKNFPVVVNWLKNHASP
mmetsp:Transcript_10560/g.19993  ORF Transcript_10560/g.19993 Transcript_10560/m.19993 type:complete len:950 (-) Transcript_10560:124-2973(-)